MGLTPLIPGYLDRLRVRPGITGLWQVAGRSDVKNFNNWAEMDLKYIDSWSLSIS